VESTPRSADGPGGVLTIARFGQELILGGHFISIRGDRRRAIAIVSATTGAAIPWHAPAQISDVTALTAAGGQIYIGGYMGKGDQSEAKVLAITFRRPTLVWAKTPDVGDGLPAASVIATAPGSVFIGGAMDHFRGADREGIATIDLSKKTVRRWSASFRHDGEISPPTALVIGGDTLYAGGGFSTVNGRARDGLAAFDARTGELLDWRAPPMGDHNYGVTALTVDDTRLYVGGDFVSWGDVSQWSIAAFDRKTGAVEHWGPSIRNSSGYGVGYGVVYALQIRPNALYVGGEFNLVGERRRAGIAALDRRSGTVLDWSPDLATLLAVNTIAVSDQAVYAGGWCISCEGDQPNGVRAIDANGRVQPVGASIRGESIAEVRAIALDRSHIVVAGSFDHVGGAARPGLAVIDASTGDLSPWVPAGRLSPYWGVSEVLVVGDVLVVAGRYGGELAAYRLPGSAAAYATTR
jgi:hypothetical protein